MSELVGEVIDILEARGNKYGPALQVSARLWSAALEIKVTPAQVAGLMALMKVAREIGGGRVDESNDSVKDLLGYLILVVQMEKIREEQAADS
jgi:hypothetical protein